MSKVYVYDEREVSIVLATFMIREGRAEEFLRITEPDAFEAETGLGGTVIRYPTGNALARAEIGLKGVSPSNAELSALYALDANATNGAGIGQFMVKDNNGATLFVSPTAWIAGRDTVTFGRQRGDITWKIDFHWNPAAAIVGGNG